MKGIYNDSSAVSVAKYVLRIHKAAANFSPYTNTDRVKYKLCLSRSNALCLTVHQFVFSSKTKCIVFIETNYEIVYSVTFIVKAVVSMHVKRGESSNFRYIG